MSHHRHRPMPESLARFDAELQRQVDTVLQTPHTQIKLTATTNRLYKYVEFLCNAKHQRQLADSLYEKIQKRTTELVELSETAFKAQDPRALASFVQCFDLIQSKLDVLQRVFLYLDRTYLLHHPTKKVIGEFGLLNLYGELVQSGVWDSLLDVFLRTLDQWRRDKEGDVQLLQQFWTRFWTLSKWSDDLEQTLVDSTARFYHGAHRELMDSVSHDAVFEVFYDTILAESNFWKACAMSEEFMLRLESTAIEELILQNFEHECAKFVYPLFTLKKYTQLTQLFLIVDHCSGPSRQEHINEITTQWSNYVQHYVSTIIMSHTDDDDTIEALIRSKKILNVIVERFFNNNTEMEYKLRESFQAALERAQDHDNINKKLMKYIDAFFRGVATDKVEADKSTVHDIHLIFKSTTDKEQLMKLDYRRDLSRRLLNHSDRAHPLEKELLELIAQEINPEITDSLTSMFDDLEESKEFQSKFHTDNEIEFNPMVLKENNWLPAAAENKVKFPDELNSLLEEFTKFYTSTNDRYSQRKVKWTHNLGTMNIMAHFPNCSQEISVTTSQGLVLLLFNDADSLSFDEIKRATRMSTKSVAGALYSLTQSKYKVLVKLGEKYAMNPHFEKPKKKTIKIKPISAQMKNSEIVEASPKPEDTVDEWIMEAYIIRTLKHMTRCSYAVMDDKVRQRFGEQDHKRVKACIESLISREMMTRDQEKEEYVYLP